MTTSAGKTSSDAMPLVYVEWEDSYGCSTDWVLIDGAEPKVMVCRSVGWLAYEGDDVVVVIPHVSTPLSGVAAQGCGDMTISTRCVRRIVHLKEPDPP